MADTDACRPLPAEKASCTSVLALAFAVANEVDHGNQMKRWIALGQISLRLPTMLKLLMKTPLITNNSIPPRPVSAA